MFGAGAAMAADGQKTAIKQVFLNGQEIRQIGGVPLQHLSIEVTQAGILYLYAPLTTGPLPTGAAETPLKSVPAGLTPPAASLPPISGTGLPSSSEPTQNTAATNNALTETYWLLFVPESLPAGISATIWVNDVILDVLGSTEQQVKEVTRLLKRGENTVKVTFSAAQGLGLPPTGRIQLTLAKGGLDSASQELRLEYPILSLTRVASELPGQPEFFKFGLPLPERK